jgi:hypothetical protein
MPDTKKTRSVVVTGDVTMDWNIARTQRLGNDGKTWNAQDSIRTYWQRGGAALLADLAVDIAAEIKKSGNGTWQVISVDAPMKAPLPDSDLYNHSFALWSFTRKVQSDKKESVWRVREFLGLDRKIPDKPAVSEKIKGDSEEAEIVVIDDADLGFRSASAMWPKAIVAGKKKPWIIVKMARPVGQGDLWQHLLDHHSDRLILVMTISDLRLSEVHISRELSWESAAQDLAWELQFNPRFNGLSRCAHMLVTFDCAGVFCSSRLADGSTDMNLFFDRKVSEGSWADAYPGGMVGYSSCLVAGLLRQIMIDPSAPNVTQGVHDGMRAMRTLHIEGYGKPNSNAGSAELKFPQAAVLASLGEKESALSEVRIEVPKRNSPEGSTSDSWTILETQYPRKLKELAESIVREGVESAIRGVPLGTYGALTTIDRREIESFQSIKRLMTEYHRQTKQTRPLSIAVFGPPGSGKSFGVTQVAKGVLGDKTPILTFNLSQFNGPDDLIGAFHQIRDAAIGGSIPLVFWDEFDTTLGVQPLGWLRYFLAPMQDASFLEGQITHPLGRAVFVFAGGTSPTIEAFGQGLTPEKHREAKVPDFVSRLKGYVNVLGPNRQGDDDTHAIIRRAILLRSMIERNAPHLCRKDGDRTLIELDPGLLRAFLETREFRHGARSMESVIAMSLLAGHSKFERSSLPPMEQLDMHVNAKDFRALIYLPSLEGGLLDQLAKAAHEVFCDELRKKGYKLGAVTNEKKKVHSALKDFDQLPEDEKEQNRDNVRDIPSKLALVGFAMLPAVGNRKSDAFTVGEIEHLAEREHERWMMLKIQVGWRWAKGPKDTDAKKHPDILTWTKLSKNELLKRYPGVDPAVFGPRALSEKEKNKDRRLVRDIPKIVEKAGMRVVRVGGRPAKDK